MLLLFLSLDWGFGVRALSMGNAYTGVAEGCASVYYNPAGLYRSSFELGYLHSELFFGDTWDQVAVSIKGFGFGYASLSCGEFTLTDTLGNITGTGSSRESMVLVGGGWGYRFLSLGLTFKVYRSSLVSLYARGYGVDAGILFDFGFLRFGGALRDIYSRLFWSDGKEEGFGPYYSLGLSFIPLREPRVLLSLQGETWEEGLRFSLGFECEFKGGIAIRAGYGDGFSLGFGLRKGFAGVDYGFYSVGDLPLAHNVGITIRM